jgi:dihydrofolate reductase
MSKTRIEPSVEVIAAVASNRGIGLGNSLPWNLPEDLRRFKALTVGHTVVMGRKTYESIGRPLPDRRNVVVTRSGTAFAGVETTSSLHAALSHDFATAQMSTFMIGGGQLYAQTLEQFVDRISKIHLTVIHAEIVADAFFPPLDWSQWKCIEREPRTSEGQGNLRFEWQTWVPRTA